MREVVYSEVVDVKARLRKLGLSVSVLHEAIRIGEAHRNACTENDPSSFPGMIAWARTVRSLRELLASRGWLRSNEHRIPLVLNPSGVVAIAVATGNTDTGNTDTPSKTKHPKGPATVAAVKQNAVQLAFDFYEEKGETLPQKTSDCLTWVLLFSHCSGEIRCELSLPNSIGEDSRVSSWNERIILPPVSMDTTPEPLIYEEEDTDDIIVKISRRNTQP